MCPICGACPRIGCVLYVVHMFHTWSDTYGQDMACVCHTWCHTIGLLRSLIIYISEQTYQAKFRISYFVEVDPPASYPGLSSTDERRAMRIAEIAFMALFDDTRQLVADGVRSDIASRVLQAETPLQKSKETKRGKDREKYLKEWLKSEQPLKYGHGGGGETFQALLQAVVPAEMDIAYGLPNITDHSMTRSRLVDLLIAMSTPSSPSRPSAPVMKDGTFLPVLKEAHRILLVLSQETTNDSRRSFVSSYFFRAIEHLRISFVPSHPSSPSGPGAPRTKPVFNSWALLGLPQSRPLHHPLPQPSAYPSSSQQAADVALASTLASDSNSEWFVKPITLATLHTVLHKTSLPADFAAVSHGKEEYVTNTYNWVRANYDGTNTIHHFALVVSIIASSLIPRLFMPKDVKSHFLGADSREGVRKAYHTVPWVIREKKGMADASIFISMFTTFIIALYEPTSPLRQHIDQSPRKGLGNAWTDKHSMLPLSFPSSVYSRIFSF
jgi:hypothetical protein